MAGRRGYALVIMLVVLTIGLVAGRSSAADHPIGGRLLRLKDRKPKRRKLVVRTAPAPSLQAIQLDPRIVGARFEIIGAGPGDGAAGPVILPPSLWRGRGRPRGRTGFKYVDPKARQGIRRAILKFSATGGSLIMRAGGRKWPYAIDQPQGPIDVRFAIGDALFCARFGEFTHNETGRVLARGARPPTSCGSATAMRCGDGRAEGREECDDGNSVDGDGCSAACELETIAGICAGVPVSSGTSLSATRVATGLDRPVHIAAARLDPNRLFVVEQPGRIRIIENDVLLPTAFLNITDRVSCCGERGLLSVAFHPNFEATGRVFVNYTDSDGGTVVARYQLGDDPNRIDVGTERVVLTIPQPFGNHNGGQIAFGPDGYLYVAMGDGGGGGDPQDNAQDDATLLGKLLRLDVDVDDGAPLYYAVPANNPNPGAGGPLALIWAKGLRNPWRFSFDRGTGDLFTADVGQNEWEEINRQPASSAGGENYGWDIFEGDGHCFEPTPPASDCPDSNAFTRPVHEYANFDNGSAPGEGCSVTGGFVYRGCRMPDLAGTYFYSDFCSAFIRTFEVVGGVARHHADRTAELAAGGGPSIDSVTSFGEDARGELYIADQNGEIFRIVPGE